MRGQLLSFEEQVQPSSVFPSTEAKYYIYSTC